MATAAKIENVKPSRHFMTMLEALLNAPTEDYDERLAEVLDYVSACENNANITALQASVVWSLRSQERQRKTIKRELAKLTRFDMAEVGQAYHTRHEMKQADLGDYVSFYDVMSTVK